MADWGLVVETTVGSGDRKHIEGRVLAHVRGAREDALAELRRQASAYRPTHPLSPKRRRLYRHGDGFLLVVDGAWQSFTTRFTLAELVEDSAAPAPAPVPEQQSEPQPQPQPEPEDTVPSEPVARYDDGVPVKPSWWGRSDLS
ncbi:hypothetical protein AB0J38_28345 [Streptomyces sp. NPDC050095]|uniref:hypothetical protein n=1 Tax=unclassified Streptomyces TaxID=2593676 RepID=UPI003421E71A